MTYSAQEGVQPIRPSCGIRMLRAIPATIAKIREMPGWLRPQQQMRYVLQVLWRRR